PGTPNWSGVKTPQVWEGSPFYVATESRPWFLQKEVKSRISAINSIGCDGSFAHIILSEETQQPERSSTYLESRPLHLLPIAADDQSSLLAALDHLQATIENTDSLKDIASQTFVKFQQHSQSKYT
ncbi:MAG: ketoacyl-synthetase C-terminal extension domain-containing protein, partial [Dolichospermum sp.]